uniref:pentatricopeptide repeat-containing protein At2g27800, mitochondrial-like n=1 Tax=Erigeron canadensis TaxID=72917 RepID=UPI001CB99DD0|nr:pentatricopeptide repeat-containing protein At2g27800, mitochondrial-like [Erigeron canadensis]
MMKSIIRQLSFIPKPHQNPNHHQSSLFSSLTKRTNQTPPLTNQTQFNQKLSQLVPRFTPTDLYNLINKQHDPLLCLHLFNWASKQNRYTHNVSTYHIIIKKLGAAKMYDQMDLIVNEVLSFSCFGNEHLYNTVVYFYTEFRKLSKAVCVYKHMRNVGKLNSECRPSIRTYNLLFTAFLSRRSNSYINHVYMDTMSMLFKQMVNDGIEPDIFALNCMIKGYVISLHVNDALRLYHQMGVVYDVRPNSFTFDYLIHGLCAQGRTCNAGKICGEMKLKGFVPSSKSYNSLVSAFALEGEVDKAVGYLWEMVESERVGDYITYWTLIDECCGCKRIGDAMSLLEELQEKRVVDRHTYMKLRHEVEVKYGNLCRRNSPKSQSQ